MGTRRRRIALFCALVCLVSLWSLPLRADDADSDGFEQWQNELSKAFQEHVSEEEKGYAAYQQEIEQEWQVFVGSTRKDWVEYSGDKSTRSIVDFKQGEITLEAVIPVNDDKNSATAKRKILEKIANQLLVKRLREILADKSVAGKSPIAGQVMLKDGKELGSGNVNRFAEQKFKDRIKIETSPYIAKDGKKRIKAKVSVKMVPDHLKIRAEKFRKPVETFSRKYGVDKSLVLAVIHTESYFNPKARSAAPAYGLMQLVPTSGGRDAYRRVHGKDRPPTLNFLYNPNNNIELGTAYLDLLGKRDFKRVKNAESRLYLIVAAYNTGAGNVSRAIAGHTNLRKTIDKINKMSPDVLFTTLKRDLPYKETRDYLQKVVKRQSIYQGF